MSTTITQSEQSMLRSLNWPADVYRPSADSGRLHCIGQFDQSLAVPAITIPGLSRAPEFAYLKPESAEFRFLTTRLCREQNPIPSNAHVVAKRMGKFRGASIDAAQD